MLRNLDATTTSTSRPLPSTSPKVAVDPAKLPKTHLYVAPEKWEWRELRDYIVYEITRLTGEFSGHPTSSAAEAEIFKNFIRRYGSNAQRIARYALDTCEGVWYAAPVSIFTFCKNADATFADPILNLLERA